MRHRSERKRSNRSSRRGWALFDTLLAIGISGSMIASMGSVISDVHERQIAQSVASHINQIAPVVKNYIDRNYAALIPYVPVNATISIPLSGNSVWNGIGDVASSSGSFPTNWTNVLPGGQRLYLVAHHYPLTAYSPDHMSAMLITSGGSPMSDKQVGLAALMLDGMGGSITKNTYGSANAGQINGLAGAWSEQASAWSSAAPVTYGHVALFLTGSSGALSPYLNRYNIGNAEAQRMHTSIDVNANDLNNIRTTDTEYVRNSRADDIQFQSTISGTNSLRLSGISGAVNAHGGLNLCEDNVSGCGISISDSGGFFDEGDGWVTLRMADSSYGLHVQGNVQVDGNVGTSGYSPTENLPAGTTGGVHTEDVYAEGTIFTGHNGSINTLIGGSAPGSEFSGHVIASTVSGGQIFRPNLTVVDGQDCSAAPAALSLGGAPTDVGGTFVVQNGDIAKDTDGNIMSCVSGTWQQAGGKQFSRVAVPYQCGPWSGVNTSSKTHMLIVIVYAGHKGATSNLSVNGMTVGHSESTVNEGRVDQTMTTALPPGASWNIWGTSRVSSVCHVEYE